MADVDFSHAVLDVNSNEKPLDWKYLMLGEGQDGSFYDSTKSRRINSGNITTLTNTPTKVSLLYTGTFIESGTSFYIRFQYYTDYFAWKVSNISFSTNDTYSFIIDVEVSGNT